MAASFGDKRTIQIDHQQLDFIGMDDDARHDLDSIINEISSDDRQMIADLPDGQVILLHHGLGRSVRNRIRSNEVTALVRWAIGQAPGSINLDELSHSIIVEVAKSLKATLRPAGR